MYVEYPAVMLYIKVKRNVELSRKQKIIDIFKEISKRPGWRGVRLSATDPDSNIIHERSFRELLAEEDHVLAIKTYFLEVLEEVSTIKKNYPVFMEETDLEGDGQDQDFSNGEY